MTVASPPPPPGASAGMPAPPAAPKKGLGPLGWIAIGCGSLIVLSLLSAVVLGYFFKKKVVDPLKENPTVAAAELLVRASPDLEVVSSDPQAGTLTIKNTKTGETVTMNAEDIKEGKLSFETDQGTTVIDATQNGESGSVQITGNNGQNVTFGAEAPKDLPSWVPIYPGSAVQGAMDSTSDEGRTASFALSTDDGVDDVVSYYETELKNAGLKVTKNVMEAAGQRSGMLSGTSDDEKRTVTVIIGAQDGKTQASINFQEKK